MRPEPGRGLAQGPSTSEPERGSAAGVALQGLPLGGLHPIGDDELPRVQIHRRDEQHLDELWAQRARSPRRVFLSRHASGGEFLVVEQDEHGGTWVRATGHGEQLLSADGRDLELAAFDGPAWASGRLLASQALPILSTLRGHEVLHAGAVGLGGRLIGVTAASGTGKSSTLAHLVGGGATFAADDVLALELDGTAVRAHPGPRLMNLAAGELDGFTADERARLGPEIGRSDKVHLEPPAGARPGRLDGLVFLERDGRGGPSSILPVAHPGPRVLSTAYLRWTVSQARVVRQLDVAAAVAQTVPIAVLRIGTDDDARAIAARLATWAEGLP